MLQWVLLALWTASATPPDAPRGPASDLLVVVVHIAEACSPPRVDVAAVAKRVADFGRLRVLDQKEMCKTGANKLLSDLVPNGLVIASMAAENCQPLRWLVNNQGGRLVTWTCPEGATSNRFKRIGPTVEDITQAIKRVVLYMKWRSVCIISIADSDWWTNLGYSIETRFTQSGLLVRSFIQIPAPLEISDSLQILTHSHCRAIIISAPQPVGVEILKAIDHIRLDSFIVAMDASTPSHYHPVNLQVSPHLTDRLLLLRDAPLNTSTAVEDEIVHYVSQGMRELGELSGQAPAEARFQLVDFERGRSLLTIGGQSEEVWESGDFADWLSKHLQQQQLLEDEEGGDGMLLQVKTVHIMVAMAILGVVLVVAAALVLVAVSRFRRKKMGKRLYKVLLNPTNFTFPQSIDSKRVDESIETMLCCWLQQLQEFGGPEVDKPDLLKGSIGSFEVRDRHGSDSSAARNFITDQRVRYNGDLVQMKPLPATQQSSGGFEIRTKAAEILTLIHGLRHENLNPVIGCLVDCPRPSLVSEWCSRGSLEDVLIMDEIKLDWSFRLSLLTDLVRGMRYLHSSPVKVHGCLTSRNCVVDARWVLKVADYGLQAFYEAQGLQQPQRSARALLWTAPELLRQPEAKRRPTQPGDVYSFGIVMQEVVVRGEPFCMLTLTPEEIIEKIKRPPPLIRPSVSKGAAPPEAINIMRQCWAEQADMRPNFNEIHDLFKKLNHGRKVNIVDTMFKMLEKYSNNLEELIKERTEQLDQEKKRTEQLLNRMIPSTVAEKLKRGMPVDPEEFEEVTIYFSDIVGFTNLSAHSTPFQVVDLLNDLYTCFDATINAYNVYKVETIGDAYMVVSGLPVRTNDHAEQIATMALDLLHQSGQFRIRHLPKTSLRLRIGLHTGQCCAGVVGLTMPRYCLFGDTVNTASRMESTGAAWRIHMSENTKSKLEAVGGYQIEYRGPTDVKGKGQMPTYWLLGKDGFDKPLPIPPTIDESHGMDESLIVLGGTEEEEEETKPELASAKSFQQILEPANLLKELYPTIMEETKFAQDSALKRALDTSKFAVKMNSSGDVATGFRTRQRKVGFLHDQEDDLSTPYNHYRCIAPTEKSGAAVAKFLRRQYSVDKTDDTNNSSIDSTNSKSLQRQTSEHNRGELDKIEEIIVETPPPPQPPQQQHSPLTPESFL